MNYDIPTCLCQCAECLEGTHCGSLANVQGVCFVLTPDVLLEDADDSELEDEDSWLDDAEDWLDGIAEQDADLDDIDEDDD